MFKTLKEKLDYLEVVKDLSGSEIQSVGSANYILEGDICPSCGHSGCFRIHTPEDDIGYARCFSEDKTWDIISLTALLKGLSQYEAAKFLSKSYNIPLPIQTSPLQEVFNLAAEYYHTCLLETCSQAELGGLTPVEYQIQNRNHSLETLKEFKIGWSDGGLLDYLASIGIDEGILKESGFVNRVGKDFFSAKLFIYPHYVGNNVSCFTQKDPLKRVDFQFPKKYRINSVIVYGQDTLDKDGDCIVVEGENDLLSVYEAGHTGPLFCINGSLSKEQLDWFIANLKDRKVVTIFDPDPAGDLYREKFAKVKGKFTNLTQIKLNSSDEDIDKYLKSGNNLEDILIPSTPTSSEGLVEEGDGDEEASASSIIEKEGCYFKIRFKEGEPTLVKISNFTIRLHNIYIKGNEREREVIVTRQDGKVSPPIKVTSESKVSLKPFKVLVANAVDATFYGREEDMSSVWEHVYTNSKEKVVYLCDYIGRREDFHGWLFRNCFISDTGAKYYPDDTGAIWLGDRNIGIKPTSIISANYGIESDAGIPDIGLELSEEETRKLLRNFLENLGKNLGDLGHALVCLAWMWATAYSNSIFSKRTFFPYLFVWGKTKGGKSTIMGWLRAIYDMVNSGVVTVKTFGSGVSFSKKLGYYASLPLCIDELRYDQESTGIYAGLRTWYARTPRDVKDNSSRNNIIQDPVRATIMVSGEDHLSDDASRNRCIPVRIASNESREMRETYSWIESNKHLFPNIGRLWVSESGFANKKEMLSEIIEKENVLRNMRINARAAEIWSIVYYFGNKLAEDYFPNFNFPEYLMSAASDDVISQEQSDTLTRFWEVIEGMQAEERSKITGDHIRRCDNELYVWFAEIFRAFEREQRSSTQEAFSGNAIRELIKEQPYFKADSVRRPMGISETQRRVMIFDLGSASEVLQRIADAAG